VSFKSVDELLDFAISKEEKAVEFYTNLADRFENQMMRDIFMKFAGEEEEHKEKLKQIKQGKTLLPAEEKVMDMKIADYIVDEEPHDEMNYIDALIMAMKMEKASFRLYSDLAESTNNPSLASTLRTLAQEEAKHKLRFELEYDNHVQQDN